MLFKRISRAQAETAFIVIKNVSGSTITAGYSTCFDVGGSVDGVRVSKCNSTDMQAYAGVIDATLKDGGYGLVQVYGYRASTLIYASTGSTVTGDNLTVVGAQWGLTPATSVGSSKAFGFICEALSQSSSSQHNIMQKAFIRAL